MIAQATHDSAHRGRTNKRHGPIRMALSLALILSGSASAGEGAFKHAYMMRGQVLEASAGEVVVCVGKRDGAQAGQVLNVVRHVSGSSYGKRAGPRFRKVDVGSVRITSLFDDHYANATVVKGAPRVNDVVELERTVP